MSFKWLWRRIAVSSSNTGIVTVTAVNASCNSLAIVTTISKTWSRQEFRFSRLLGNQRIEDAWDTRPRFAKQFLVMIHREQFYRSFGSLPEACKPRTEPVTTLNGLEAVT